MQLASTGFPVFCHKYILHIHTKTKEENHIIQEHFTFSFKQGLLTFYESPSYIWEWDSSLASQQLLTTGKKDSLKVPKANGRVDTSSTRRGLYRCCSQTRWGWHMQSPTFCHLSLWLWGSRLRSKHIRTWCLQDLFENKTGWRGNKCLFLCHLYFMAITIVRHRTKDTFRILNLNVKDLVGGNQETGRSEL